MNQEHWLRWSPRPLAMMVSVITFLYSGIGISLLNTLLAVNGIPVVVPPIDAITQNNMMIILLGVGVMRSLDKRVV